MTIKFLANTKIGSKVYLAGEVVSFAQADEDTQLNAGTAIRYKQPTIAVDGYPIWVKVAGNVNYTYFTTAGTSKSVPLFTLPAGGIIHAIKIKHSQPFQGGAISAYTLSVGITGTNAKYASAFDVKQAVSGTAFQLSTTAGCESTSADTVITATATSTSANLSVATQGVVDVWALVSNPVP